MRVAVELLTADQALANAMSRHGLSSPGASIEAVATGTVGLHATSPVSPYLSVRARVAGFERAELDALMWEAWRLVRFRAVRNTMFLLPLDLLEIAASAMRRSSENLAKRWLAESGMSIREFERLAVAVEDCLADQPRTVRELRRALAIPTSMDLPGVVSRLCDLGRLVGGAPPRSWTSSIRRYHRWQDVVPGVDLHRWNEDDAVGELVLRYVSSYGPVTLNDLSWWSGLTKGRCHEALEALDERVEGVTVDGWPGPLYRERRRDDDGELGSAVKALPLLDPYVQGYRDRGRFLRADRHGFVYDGGGNATATLIHRGRIIGVWQIVRQPRVSVRYHLIDRVPASVRRSAEAELAEAGSLYFDRSVDVVAVSTMRPLSAGGGRSAAHPLDGHRSG